MTRIFGIARTLFDGFAALLLGSMFACFIVQIAFRYIFGWPVGWTIEYVSIAWLWGILFGYAFVVRDAEIIRLDLFFNMMPQGVQRFMDVVAQTTCAVVLLWSLPKAIDYINFMQIERTSYLRINFMFLFSIYVPFVIAVSIRCLRIAWTALRGYPHDQSVVEHSQGYD